MNKNSISPLRYPGGKGQFYDKVEKIIELNDLYGCVYVEPFAGGASIALKLLFDNKVKRVVINDLDRSIYAFWHSILNKTDQFINLIQTTNINIEEWYQQKEIQNNKKNADLLELGFSTFFLNRTNRSGILKAGPIGGKQQDGNYLIDCRYNKTNLIKLIEKIAKFKSKIKIYNLDASLFLKRFKNLKKEKYLIFLDPPYYKQGKNLYVNFFTHNDHLHIADTIDNSLKNQFWFLTYDNCEEIKHMYEKLNVKEYSLRYSVTKNIKATELLIYNENLNMPEIV